MPFNSWLKLAEERVKDISTLPRSREDLLKRQEEVLGLHSDVTEHGEVLDGVESGGSSFISTAKVCKLYIHLFVYTLMCIVTESYHSAIKAIEQIRH